MAAANLPLRMATSSSQKNAGRRTPTANRLPEPPDQLRPEAVNLFPPSPRSGKSRRPLDQVPEVQHDGL